MKRTLLLGLMLWGCTRAEAPPPLPTSGPCAPTARSQLLGCWKVETTTAGQSLQVGMLLAFGDAEVTIRGDPDNWVRMPLQWESAPQPHRLVGAMKSGEPLELQAVNGRLVVIESGRVLATASRVGGADAVAAGQLLEGLPSFRAMQQRAKDCFAAYARLRPGDDTFRDTEPDSFKTTASIHALLHLAQAGLLRDCQPVPESCDLPPLNAEGRKNLAAAKKRCVRE